ncbi:MAG: ATP-binding cassette domain-containing protein [Gemmatimonas sp.]|nr:ATP-binding cassette domain-containing protein [Gemmatimonas sp.]
MEGLSKTFPGQRALDRVNLAVRRKEVHGLVGANGSGKSTLVKILSGYHGPDADAAPTCVFAGAKVALPLTPGESHRLGMRFVHQDLGLVPSLSISENIGLAAGFPTGVARRIRWRAQLALAREGVRRVGLERSPQTIVERLSPVERVLVAISRVLLDQEGTQLLIMDEPTANLPHSEVERVHAAVREIVGGTGAGVLYVTHRIEELFALCSQITVLRDGKVAALLAAAETDTDTVVAEIVGQRVDQKGAEPGAREGRAGGAVLVTKAISARVCNDVSVELRRGEIAGAAGESASGKSEFGRVLFGLTQPTSGTLLLEGKPVKLAGPAEAMAAGIALIPPDRLRQGSIGELSVRENVTLASLDRSVGGALAWLSIRQEKRDVAAIVRDFDVRPSGTEHRLEMLSGGNRQKVLLGKWWQRKPKVFVLDEPTSGMDVGAKAAVHSALRRAAADGAAVLVLSSDEVELSELCDRVLVFRAGAVIDELAGSRLSRQDILTAYYGNGDTGGKSFQASEDLGTRKEQLS